MHRTLVRGAEDRGLIRRLASNHALAEQCCVTVFARPKRLVLRYPAFFGGRWFLNFGNQQGFSIWAMPVVGWIICKNLLHSDNFDSYYVLHVWDMLEWRGLVIKYRSLNLRSFCGQINERLHLCHFANVSS